MRAPLQQIVCNNSLSKQTRLLWIWLASLKPGETSYKWSDCESALGCQTKARKNCLAQLVYHGFITIKPNGIVVINDPYEVFENEKLSASSPVIVENRLEEQCDIELTSPIESPNCKEQSTQEPVKTEKKQAKSRNVQLIIDAWNKYKPQSYQKLRTLSIKQLEAFDRQLKNLKKDPSETEDFIRIICTGISKSDFWIKTLPAKGRNFAAIFGYGNAGDTKLKNVETLYELGLSAPSGEEETFDIAETPQSKEEINAYRMIKMNYVNAKRRGDIQEIKHWEQYLMAAEYNLVNNGVNLDDL